MVVKVGDVPVGGKFRVFETEQVFMKISPIKVAIGINGIVRLYDRNVVIIEGPICGQTGFIGSGNYVKLVSCEIKEMKQ